MPPSQKKGNVFDHFAETLWGRKLITITLKDGGPGVV